MAVLPRGLLHGRAKTAGVKSLDARDERLLRALWARLTASVARSRRKGRIRIEAHVIVEDGRVSLDSQILAPESLHETLDGGG